MPARDMGFDPKIEQEYANSSTGFALTLGRKSARPSSSPKTSAMQPPKSPAIAPSAQQPQQQSAQKSQRERLPSEMQGLSEQEQYDLYLAEQLKRMGR